MFLWLFLMFLFQDFLWHPEVNGSMKQCIKVWTEVCIWKYHILKAHEHALICSPLLTCPTLLYFMPTFLIVTKLCWIDAVTLLSEKREFWSSSSAATTLALQPLCSCHTLQPEFSVTAVAQFIQTQVIFLAQHTFFWVFSHFVLQTHDQVL